MFNNIFGIHESALLLYGQRVGVLAGNIANADTPGYKARDLDFREILGQGQGQGQADAGASAGLSLATTSAGHIATPPDVALAGEPKYRNPYQASLDGNSVEMAVEQAAFAENNVRYQASLQLINGRIAELQFAIAGQ